METLSSFRHQKLHVDFSLTVDGKDFLVHKNVLAVSYKFFRDLFQVSPAVVHYELINWTVLRIFLTFCTLENIDSVIFQMF